MAHKLFRSFLALAFIFPFSASFALGQSGSVRPRRVNPPPESTTNTETNQPATPNNSRASASASRTAPASSSSDTTRAYALLQQRQYAAAATEAKRLSAADPNNSEAWKIAGFAEMSLRQYDEAAVDLQRALDLQRAANQEDPNTVDALAQAYSYAKKFDQALPLLIAATGRAGAQPNADMLYLRGVAQYQLNQTDDAERSFKAAVSANPKMAGALFYLGQIALKRNETDAAIAALNRATLADPRVAQAWELLTSAYLQRADAQTDAARAQADYLSAVRAAESLMRLRPDERSTLVYGRALIGSKQYERAAETLERAASSTNAQGETLYMLGFAYVNAKNYPKAVSALERAATKMPDNVNVYRLLGYAYEVQRQYAKALAAYQKGLALAPDDAELKESVARVTPQAR
ncbi:MAG TPA: tetratricopeptide repeat protein [Pyrinomonadaceae bacterium]|nr:tetratricopeptide repeat protein [Pyrinomonadaceae bacterium]